MSATGKQLLDAWMEEYTNSKRGHDSLVFHCDVSDGRVHLHGRDNKTCALTFMHPSGCVTPIVAGSRRQCMDVLRTLDEGDLAAKVRADYPPPALRIHGIDRFFTPVRGRGVVGVVEDGAAVVLLGFVQGRWALAYCEPGWSEWMFAGDRLGSVDLDLWRQMHPRSPAQPEPTPPPKPPPPPRPPLPPAPPPDERTLEVLRLHELVLGPGDDGDDPRTRIGKVVIECLEVQVERAPFDRQRRLLDFLVGLIVELGQNGLRADPVGTKGELAENFSQVLGRPVPPDMLGEALRVARHLGCNFVSLSGRVWKLRLCALTNLRSDVHRGLLEQALSSFRLGQAGRALRTSRSSAARASRPGAERAPGSTRGPLGTPTGASSASGVPPIDPATPGPPPALDSLGLISGLLLVANLFAVALEARTAACTELQGRAEFHHRSLKQIHQAHEAERERWAAERTKHAEQLLALQAKLDAVEEEREALKVELAATRADRDSRAREVDALRAEHVRIVGRLEQPEATTADAIIGQHEAGRPEAGGERADERTTVDGDARGGVPGTPGKREPSRSLAAVAVTTLAWTISGLGRQDPPACTRPSSSMDVRSSEPVVFTSVLAYPCHSARGRLGLTTRLRSRGRLGPRGPPRASQ